MIPTKAESSFRVVSMAPTHWTLEEETTWHQSPSGASRRRDPEGGPDSDGTGVTCGTGEPGGRRSSRDGV